MRSYLLAILGFGVLAGVMAAPPAKTPTPAPPQKALPSRVVKLYGVEITVPTSLDYTTRRGPDFDLYYFTARDEAKKQVLFVYDGFHPSFPSSNAPKGIKETREHLGKGTFRTVRWNNKSDNRCRETLVSLPAPDPYSPGTFYQIHFIYQDLIDEEARQSDAIITSTVLSPAPKKAK